MVQAQATLDTGQVSGQQRAGLAGRLLASLLLLAATMRAGLAATASTAASTKELASPATCRDGRHLSRLLGVHDRGHS
jgi:hypothetical protein